jgi:hypothetical protein
VDDCIINAITSGNGYGCYVDNGTLYIQSSWISGSTSKTYGDTVIYNLIGMESINIIAGNGLTGGGDLTADRTLDVGAGLGISVGADTVSIDQTASLTWTGSHIFTSGVIMNSWLATGTQITLNNLAEDVDVELKLKRTTGGDFSLFWNGDVAWTTKIFRPFDLIINRISDTEPATTWAGMVWLDP